MPILEAMACGCAVVSTDCGGPKDIIKDGENGFLVDVGNSNKLFEKAKLLLKDEGLWRTFAEQSRITVKSYSWENSVDKLECFLRDIMERALK
jgi:glycosyltransferase involved in cell wall biosynthesis